MRALAVQSATKEASSRSRAVVSQKQPSHPTGVPVFNGIIPTIQRKPFCPCDGGCPRCKGGGMIQPKLTIGQPNDRYEQEADRVADQVMRMPEPVGSLVNRHWSLVKGEKESSLVNGHSSFKRGGAAIAQTKPIAEQISPLVQRKCSSCGEPDEEEPVQLKSSTGKLPQVTEGFQSQIQSMRGGGQPLSKFVRNYFELRFGHDFNRVRIHTGAKAEESARQINALAYTVGHDIVFGAGQFAPETMAGRRLLAHELTHAVQQSGIVPAASIQRQLPGDSQYPFPHPDFPGTEPYKFPPRSKCAVDLIKFARALGGDPAAIRHVLDCCQEGIPIAGEACLSHITNILCEFIGQNHPLCNNKPPGNDVDPKQCSPYEDVFEPYKGQCCKKNAPRTMWNCCEKERIYIVGGQPTCCPPGTVAQHGLKCITPPPYNPPICPDYRSPSAGCVCPPERLTPEGICCAEDEVFDPLGDCKKKQPTPPTPPPPPPPPSPPTKIIFKKDFPQAWNTFNDSVINQGEFDNLVDDMKKNPGKYTQIVGNASSEGTKDYNLRLTKRRVLLIVSELKKREIEIDSRLKKSPDPTDLSDCGTLKEGLYYCGEKKASESPDFLDRNVAVELFLSKEAAHPSSPLRGNPVLQDVFDGKGVIRKGDRGEAVRLIQTALMNAGFQLPVFGADGIFGSETEAAVKQLQISEGLMGNAIDGIIGPITMALIDNLFSTKEKKTGKK